VPALLCDHPLTRLRPPPSAGSQALKMDGGQDGGMRKGMGVGWRARKCSNTSAAKGMRGEGNGTGSACSGGCIDNPSSPPPTKPPLTRFPHPAFNIVEVADMCM